MRWSEGWTPLRALTRVSCSARQLLPLALVATLAVAAPANAVADRAEAMKGSGKAGKPGARSLDDGLFPQIGNGGYDAKRYSIKLDYDPASNRFRRGTRTTMIARTTKNLGPFTMDFQDLRVTGVSVNGRSASFKQVEARPTLSKDPKVTQPMKLAVFPSKSTPQGNLLKVTVSYRGEPQAFVDTDGSLEGWVQACSRPGKCDGSFVVNEPLGAQSWFPSNNYMTDKARFRTAITVPASHTAIGVGELTSSRAVGKGKKAWIWEEDDPTATYLTSATVGRFEFSADTADLADGRSIPLYVAIDSASTAAQQIAVNVQADRIPEITDFLSEIFGPYPFDSTGLIADWAPNIGYALENQTKPHFAGDRDGPAVYSSTLAHEIAHQWMGDSVSPATWHEIWFGEGWATVAEVLFDARVEGRKAPEAFFAQVYAVPKESWKVAPARLDDDPAKLFSAFPVYERPGAMLEGYREIVGDERFSALARSLQARYGYATITAKQFVTAAKESSGLTGADLERLGAYFHQWLYGTTKPALTPADFPAN